MRTLSIIAAAVVVLAIAPPARANESAEGSTKTYFIKCAEVRSADPLVVRTRAGKGVTIALDGGVPRDFLNEGSVHFAVEAMDGETILPTLPSLEYKLDEAEYTEFVFHGHAKLFVEGPYLVVRSSGNLSVTYGENHLPFDLAELEEAFRIDIGMMEGEPPPHVPIL